MAEDFFVLKGLYEYRFPNWNGIPAFVFLPCSSPTAFNPNTHSWWRQVTNITEIWIPS
jgi:hypothetical protein